MRAQDNPHRRLEHLKTHILKKCPFLHLDYAYARNQGADCAVLNPKP